MTLIKYAPPGSGGSSGLRNVVLSAPSKDFLTTWGLNVGILGGTICSIARGFDSQGNPNDAIVKVPSSNPTVWTIPANSTRYLWINDEGNFGVSENFVVKDRFLGEENPQIIDPYPESIGTGITLSQENSLIAQTAAAWRSARFKALPEISRQYFECRVNSIGSGGSVMIGVMRSDQALSNYPGQVSPSFGYHFSGLKYISGTSSAFGSAYTTGDTISIALDSLTGRVWAAKNNVWQASGSPVGTGTNPAATLTPGGDYRFAIGVYNSSVKVLEKLTYLAPPGSPTWNSPGSGTDTYVPSRGLTRTERGTNDLSNTNRLFLGKVQSGSSSISSLITYPILGKKTIPLFFSTANVDTSFDINMPGDNPIVSLIYPVGATGCLTGANRDQIIARSSVAGNGLAILDRGY